jgi:hypothetical protein
MGFFKKIFGAKKNAKAENANLAIKESAPNNEEEELIKADILLEKAEVKPEKSEKKEGVLFEESRIGYMPEGFEKVKEGVSYSRVYYKFQNSVGEYIILKIHRDTIESAIDNSEIQKDIFLNK